MKNKIFLLIFLTSFWRETQGSPSPSIQNTCKDNTFTLCKDGATSACSCREAAANGWCYSDPYTIQNCRLTCGICQPGSPNSVAAVVSEVPVAVGYRGPCDPNPCGLGNICEVQGGAGLCKPDPQAFFGGRNVTSSLPDGLAPEEAAETEVTSVVPATDAPVKAVAAEAYTPAIAPMAGERAPVTDSPIRPIAATPKAPMVVQLGPIAERPYVPVVAPVAPAPARMAPVASPAAPVVAPMDPAVKESMSYSPKLNTPIVAVPITSAPVAPITIASNSPTAVAPITIASNGPTAVPPIAEMRSDQVTDSPIVPIAMTPDAIVAPPPIAEYPGGTAAPPPSGRDSPAGWGYKHGACESDPCGPNTKCNIAPNGLARCSCMENYIPNDNTIIGCKPMCMSNDECPGDYYCKATKCVRVCGPGACGLKADCDGYKHRAICNCPEGYTGDPGKQCVRAARNSNAESGGAAIGRFVVLDINNKITQSQEPIRVVHQDTGELVGEEDAAEALDTLEIVKEAEAAKAAAEAEKLVGKENNAIRESLSLGIILLPLILIVQI